MLQWISSNDELLAWLGLASLVMFVGTLAMIPVVVAYLPHDYFIRERRHRIATMRRPTLAFLWLVFKNAAGLCLLALGIAMLVLPGQGLLTILLGVILTDFPGKRKVELWLIRRRRIRASIEWIRQKVGRPPLKLDVNAK